MEVEFKSGDLVANQANPKEPLTFLQADIDGINAKCLDAKNKEHIIPIVALQKYKPPEPPKVSSISVW